MEPRRKPGTDDEVEAPTPRQQDRDDTRGARILPDSVQETGENNIEKDGGSPEEDQDNAYQNSDEGLPDDAEEAAIEGDHARRGGPFDAV
jgi:hypothetical protein